MGAAAAVAGQNLGAGNPDRSAHAVHLASRIGLAMAAFIGLLFYFIPEQLLAIFGMNEDVVVGIGVELLRVLSVSGALYYRSTELYGRDCRGQEIPKAPSTFHSSSQIIIHAGYLFCNSANKYA